MTGTEFKAWFEGFSEALSRPPNAAQWKLIKDRIGSIQREPVNTTIIREREMHRPFPWYRPWYETSPIWTTTSGGPLSGSLAWNSQDLSLKGDLDADARVIGAIEAKATA